MSWGERSCVKKGHCPHEPAMHTCNVDCAYYRWDGVTEPDSEPTGASRRRCVMTDQQKAREHLADLMEIDAGLNAWEITFIESVHDQEYALTQRQIDKIYDIYTRNC